MPAKRKAAPVVSNKPDDKKGKVRSAIEKPVGSPKVDGKKGKAAVDKCVVSNKPDDATKDKAASTDKYVLAKAHMDALRNEEVAWLLDFLLEYLKNPGNPGKNNKVYPCYLIVFFCFSFL
jgi:hypothetical protein